jgi:lipopolysaccharide transport system permease protein
VTDGQMTASIGRIVHTEPTAQNTPAPTAGPEILEIRPSKGLFDLELSTLWRYRELLVVLVKRDIQVVYKQAALGAAWAIIQPLLAVVIFSIIFGYMVKLPSDGFPYPVFAFAGVLPWTYFAEALRRCSTGIVGDAELIRKVYFPRLVIPLSGALAPVLDLVIAFVVLVGLMLFYGMMPSWRIITLPLLIAMTGLMALGVGLWLAPINVRFRDIKHTVPFIIQIWMYATPIVYPLSAIPEAWRPLYSINPMVGIIEGWRWAILGNTSVYPGAFLISCVIVLVVVASGLIFFKRMERTFADTI